MNVRFLKLSVVFKLIAFIPTLALAQASDWRGSIKEKFPYQPPQRFEDFKRQEDPASTTQSFEVTQISIDTRDQATCRIVQSEMLATPAFRGRADIEEICKPIKDYDLSVVTIVRPKFFHDDHREIVIPMKSVAGNTNTLSGVNQNALIGSVALVGMMWAAPEKYTKWDKNRAAKDVFRKYIRNVGSRPVMDSDEAWINYGTHPWWGNGYFVVARQKGASNWEAFGYSVLMSTFGWEYGPEAFAERPSIQDLIITPVVGSLIGLGFYKVLEHIEKNDGELWGSQGLGSFAKFFVNPVGVSAEKISLLFNSKLMSDERTGFFVKEVWVRDGGPTGQFRPTIRTGVQLNFRY